MLPDGTIRTPMPAYGFDNEMGDGVVDIRTDDPRYAYFREYIEQSRREASA
jgi:hypothetical protein